MSPTQFRCWRTERLNLAVCRRDGRQASRQAAEPTVRWGVVYVCVCVNPCKQQEVKQSSKEGLNSRGVVRSQDCC